MQNSSVSAEIGSGSIHGVELLVHVETCLYTAVVSDALDEIGYRNQAMREHIRPLWPEFRFTGWARTISCADVDHVSEDSYEREIESVDSILPEEAVVVSTGQSVRNAPWGELLSTAAKVRGARGVVVDGLVRDVEKIRALGLPVFAAGIKPVDSRGRGVVIDYDVPIECANVQVNPGDLIFADYDGVVVVPAAVVGCVIQLATNKVNKENSSRNELSEGAYLRDVFKKYGVL